MFRIYNPNRKVGKSNDPNKPVTLSITGVSAYPKESTDSKLVSENKEEKPLFGSTKKPINNKETVILGPKDTKKVEIPMGNTEEMNLGSTKKLPIRPIIKNRSTTQTFRGKGVAPALLGGGANSNSGSGMIGSNDRSMGRFTLVNAWNSQALRPVWNGYQSGITPFRAATNSGDYLSRQNFTTGGSNQVQGRVNVAITPTANVLGGSIFKNLNPSGIPSASTNVKYVYDSSDYTTYLRQFATQKTYNDYSFGGANNGSQEALSRARY
jgi:hypothetical protein